MPLPLVRYKVFLKSAAGEKVAEFDNWRKLEYEKRVNDVGYYALEIDGWDGRIPLFELDGQVEIYRTDFSNSISWYVDFEGFHRVPIRKTTEEGDRQYTSLGVGYNDLLARKVIGYKAGTIRSAKNKPSETVMKEFVRENCGENSLVSKGRLEHGRVVGFSVEEDSKRGKVWSGDRSFENVLDVLQEVAEYSKIDFSVVGIGEALWNFQTYENQLGSDRTTLGLDTSTGLNADGNVPTVFSLGFGNVRDLVYSDDHLREANVVYVLGRGDGSTRQVIVRRDQSAIDKSPRNRREISRPASKNEFTYQLKAFGDETLEAMKAIESVTFGHMRQASTIYGRDFFLGDKITLNYDGVDYHKRIVSIKVTVEAGDDIENITMEFADLP